MPQARFEVGPKAAQWRLYGATCAALGILLAFSWQGFRNIEPQQYWRMEEAGTPDVDCSCTSKPAFRPSIFGGADVERAMAFAAPGVVAAVLTLHATVLARRAWVALLGAGGCGRLLWRAAAWCAAALLAPECDEDTERVRFEAEQQRVLQVRHVISGLNVFLAPIAAGFAGWMTQLAAKGQLDRGVAFVGYYSEPVDRGEYWSRAVLVNYFLFPFCVLYLLVMVFYIRPQLVTPRMIDCLNVVFSGLWIFQYCTQQGFYEHDGWILVSRVCQGLVLGNAGLGTVLHAAVSSVYCAIQFAYWPQFVFWHVYVIGGEFIVFLFASAFYWGCERMRFSEAAALCQARQANRSSALVHRLLTGMCDAVVQLDAELRVAWPCPKLAGLLLHNHSRSAMMSHRFPDLMPAEDSQRFHSHVAQEAALVDESQPDALCEVPVHAIHVRLRDANSTAVPVELFCSCIPDSSTGLLRHMVGVREETQNEERHATQPVGAEAPACGIQTRTIPENSSVASSDDIATSLVGEAEAMCAWVAGTAPLAVLGHTPGFAALSGPLLDRFPLVEWFHNQKEFLMFFERGVNCLLSADGPQQDLTANDVPFGPPHLQRFGVHFRATVVLSMPTDAELAEQRVHEDEDLIVRISFRDVRAIQNGKRRTGKRNAPRASSQSGSNGMAVRGGDTGAAIGELSSIRAAASARKTVVVFSPLEQYRVDMWGPTFALPCGSPPPTGTSLLGHVAKGKAEIKASVKDLVRELVGIMETRAGWRARRTTQLEELELCPPGASGSNGAAVVTGPCTLSVELSVRPDDHGELHEDVVACLEWTRVGAGPAAARAAGAAAGAARADPPPARGPAGPAAVDAEGGYQSAALRHLEGRRPNAASDGIASTGPSSPHAQPQVLGRPASMQTRGVLVGL